MKLIIATVLIAMVAALSVSAADMTIVSDSNTEWSDGTLHPSVAAWVHPLWTANVNIPGATWIWRTEKVTADEAVFGSQVKFVREFEIPQCATNIKGELKVTTDNYYEIHFPTAANVASDGNWPSVETHDVSPYLGPGTNFLGILAENEPMNGGTWDTNPAGVIYSLEIDYDGCGDIPEFSTIGAGLALLGAGFIAYRKRK